MDNVEFPRFLVVVGGEKKFMTRAEAQWALFERNGVIDGHVQVSAGFVVNLGVTGAEEGIYEFSASAPMVE